MKKKKHVLIVDLKDDEALISEYEQLHKEIWPEVYESIKAGGIEDMEIFRRGNRLVMIIEVQPGFTFEKKAALDASNPKVQEWEDLMWKYQQALPGAAKGEKWQLMEKIFKLEADDH